MEYNNKQIISMLKVLLMMMLMTMGTQTVYLGQTHAQLSSDFYAESCPSLFPAVRQGCDGSILLDDTPSFRGEKTAGPNNNSVRGFEVIDKIKSRVEKLCPGVVSCADIVALSARDSVLLLSGGPRWSVKLGRRDSKNAGFSAANSGVIPSPFSTLKNLINRFKAQGLSVRTVSTMRATSTSLSPYPDIRTVLLPQALATTRKHLLTSALPQDLTIATIISFSTKRFPDVRPGPFQRQWHRLIGRNVQPQSKHLLS
ncbi:hypothetical protein Bca4012_025373 [Brassica carinata]